jgi:hypothetical protein
MTPANVELTLSITKGKPTVCCRLMSERCGEEKNLTLALQPVAIPTELSRLIPSYTKQQFIPLRSSL